MENAAAFGDLSWYFGPALVAARVASRWKQQQQLLIADDRQHALSTGCFGLQSSCEVNDLFLTSPPSPARHKRPHLLRAKKILNQLDHDSIRLDYDQDFPALETACRGERPLAATPKSWTSVWDNEKKQHSPRARGRNLDASNTKVTSLDGPGQALLVRTSPVFVYPSAGNQADLGSAPECIIYFHLAAGLSLEAAETLAKTEGLIGDGQLLRPDPKHPEICLTSSAEPGAYGLTTADGSAEVYVCRFQPEHAGHRGCLAAGYSYFVCGLTARSPPYRVVGAGRCGRSRFILSRSYAADCPRLPLFKCAANDSSASSNNSNSSNKSVGSERAATKNKEVTNTKVVFNDENSCDPVQVLCGGSPTPINMEDVPRSFMAADDAEKLSDGQSLPGKLSTNGDSTNSAVPDTSEPTVLKERLQNLCLNESGPHPGDSLLTICVLDCVERKPSSSMVREMAVLLNNKSTAVNFNLRVCGLCAPSRALLNETKHFRRQLNASSKPAALSPLDSPKRASKRVGSLEMVTKYFNQRYRLVSRFQNDLQLSEEAWFSICPEEIGKHIARRIAGLSRARGGRPIRVLDPCCGAGGNAVQCAAMPEVEHVYANDLKEQEVASARRLAALYGVEDKISFGCGDLFDLDSKTVGAVDAVVFSPPWGGPDYLDRPTFDISEMNPSFGAILRHCQGFSPNLAVLLPRNVCLDQLVGSAEDLQGNWPGNGSLPGDATVELELNLIGKKCKTATVYYGELVNRAVQA